MMYNSHLKDNNKELEAILSVIKTLPDPNGAAVELCTVTAHIPRDTGFLATTQWSGGHVETKFQQFPIMEAEWVCPVNTWLILYAPDNQGLSVEGGVEYWGETWDYQTVLCWVAGDGHIELYQY